MNSKTQETSKVSKKSSKSKSKSFNRQPSLRSFTTEDGDLFSVAPQSNHSDLSAPVACRQKTNENQADLKERAFRRRSKSVGAPGLRLKVYPAYNNIKGSHGKLYQEKLSDTKQEKHPCFVEKKQQSTGKMTENPSMQSMMTSVLLGPADLSLIVDPASLEGMKIPDGALSPKTTHSRENCTSGLSTQPRTKQDGVCLVSFSPRLSSSIDEPVFNFNFNNKITTSAPPIVVENCKDDQNADSENNRIQYNKYNRKQAAHLKVTGVSSKLSRAASYKLSRKLTGRMTTRQKQTLMMEGEFDEFDDECNECEDSKPSSPTTDDPSGSCSDNSDHEFEEKIAVQLNMQRFEEEDDGESGDEARVVEMTKVQRIANELLTTERSYVSKLCLIDQVFQMPIVLFNREHHIFPDEVIPQIFSNIKSIYQFHRDFLLPQLEKRMAEWDEVSRIGDVMRKFSPFLKLYIDYVRNFDRSMNTIVLWTEKSPKFARLLNDFQARPECCHLTLQHHMLGPVQRVPRYQLLLKDYLKHLSEDSVDREDTEKALEIVTTSAQHANDAMRKIEKFRKLLDINDSLAGIDIISPTRELVKEGKITRISARDGDLIERYLYLFNDLLLVCQSLPLSIGHNRQQYKIKSKMDVDGMEVIDSHNLDTPNTFYVKGQQKSIELHTSSLEEKIDWQMTFWTVITDYNRRLQSRKINMNVPEPVASDQLGKRAPTWVKDHETSMCMRCTISFTTFRRRHHCRACGLVVCGTCSSKKTLLAYDTHRESRVCNYCYAVLHSTNGNKVNNGETKTEPIQSPTVIDSRKRGPVKLQVKGSDPAVISGYLNMTCDKKTWYRRWFAVHTDFVMYSFKAHQDVIAMTSLPLPGYQVQTTDANDAIDRENTFKVLHVGQTKIYYFQAEDASSKNRWIDVLEKVVKLEMLPLEKEKQSTSILCFQSGTPTVADGLVKLA